MSDLLSLLKATPGEMLSRKHLLENGVTEEMLTGAEERGEVIIGDAGSFASVMLTLDGEYKWLADNGGSILLVLPADLAAKIRMTPEERAALPGRRGSLRDDLLIIPEAEAAGWKISFRNNSWHNGADFNHNGITIWSTGRDWRRAGVINGLTTIPEVFPYNMEGLRAALASTTELVERVFTKREQAS